MLHKYTLDILIKLEMMRDRAGRPDEKAHYSRAITGVIDAYSDMLCEKENKKLKKSARAGTLDGPMKHNISSSL